MAKVEISMKYMCKDCFLQKRKDKDETQERKKKERMKIRYKNDRDIKIHIRMRCEKMHGTSPYPIQRTQACAEELVE